MQEIILKHYPPAVRRIRDIQQIAKAEGKEFSKFRESIRAVGRNMFILTSDLEGIRREEGILGVTPSKGQGLEERRLYLLSMLNKKSLSLSELLSILSGHPGGDGLSLECDYENFELEVRAGEDVGSVGTVYRILDGLLPLQVYIFFASEFTVATRFTWMPAVLGMETAACWWAAGPGGWYFNGSVPMDGSRKFGAALWGQKVGLVLGTAGKTWGPFLKGGMCLETAACLGAGRARAGLALETETGWHQEQQAAEMGLGFSAKTEENFGGAMLTAQKDLWYFDGSALMDGSRKFDATEIKEGI